MPRTFEDHSRKGGTAQEKLARLGVWKVAPRKTGRPVIISLLPEEKSDAEEETGASRSYDLAGSEKPRSEEDPDDRSKIESERKVPGPSERQVPGPSERLSLIHI